MPKAKPMKKNAKWGFLASPKFAAVCGILAPIVGFSCIGAAVAISASWFNWFLHALSDLGNPIMLGGVHGTPDLNAVAGIFNGGMFVTGVLTAFFGLELFLVQRRQNSLLGMSGGILFVVAMVCLAGVGVFNEVLILGHIIAAAGFFFATMLASIAYGLALLRVAKSKLLGAFTLVMGIIILLTLLAMFGRLLPFMGVAIPEMIVAVAAYAWVVLQSVQFYRSAGKA